MVVERFAAPPRLFGNATSAPSAPPGSILRLMALRKAGEAHIRMRVISAFEPVAQSVEHVTFNHGVQGSNPCGLTKQKQGLSQTFQTSA
jgi:hypothetical protein